MLFSNNTLFSALEQFDVMNFFGPLIGGFNNMIFSIFCIFAVGFFASVGGYTATNNYVSFLALNFYTFVRKLLAENLTAEKNIYFYYTIALFGFILLSNILGLIPFSLTATSYLVITFFLSGTSFFGNLIIGVRTHS